MPVLCLILVVFGVIVLALAYTKGAPWYAYWLFDYKLLCALMHNSNLYIDITFAPNDKESGPCPRACSARGGVTSTSIG